MEERLEDLVVTKDYGLRFPGEGPKVNQGVTAEYPATSKLFP